MAKVSNKNLKSSSDIPSQPRGKRTFKTQGYSTEIGSKSHWYDQAQGKAHEAIFAYLMSIKSRQVRRRYMLARFQQLYRNDFNNLFATSGLFASTIYNSNQFNTISANVIKSCVDTATARIAKSKPRAFALPKSGDYRLKRKCKNLTKFTDGAFRQANVYKNGDDVFRDACIYGDGNMLVEAEDGAVKSTCAKVDEVWIDSVTGMYGDDKTQEIFYEHPTPRTELLARYPDKAKEIEAARLSWPGALAFMSQQDLVLVVTVWRKPSVKDGDDGRKVIAISNCTLYDEPWTKNYLPIVRFPWTPPTYGSFGSGIAQELEGMQHTIVQNIRDYDEACRLFAVPRIFVTSASGMSQHMITDEMAVIKCAEPPTFSTPPPMDGAIPQWIQWKIDYCFKQLGLSQLSAQSEKPAGVNAAVALRTYQDIETQRFAIVGQRWEAFYLKVAELVLDTAADIYSEKKSYSVNVPGASFIEQIDWKDVSLEKDLYDIQVWPTSLLPETPEGKFQAVQEYIQSGLMPRDVALSQMRMPIINDWIDEETAARDNIERMISLIEEKGKFIDPTGIGNIDLLVTLAQSAYLRSQFDDLEPGKVDLLLRLLNRGLELQKAKAAAAAPPMMPGAPPGAPGSPAVGTAATPPPAPLAPAGVGPVHLAQ